MGFAIVSVRFLVPVGLAAGVLYFTDGTYSNMTRFGMAAALGGAAYYYMDTRQRALDAATANVLAQQTATYESDNTPQPTYV